MKGLRDRNVIVTGGTSGIGQAIAVRFAAEGAHVAINYRRQPEDAAETDGMVHQALEKCVHELKAHGVNHILVQADVSSEEDVVETVQEVVAGLGGVDISWSTMPAFRKPARPTRLRSVPSTKCWP